MLIRFDGIDSRLLVSTYCGTRTEGSGQGRFSDDVSTWRTRRQNATREDLYIWHFGYPTADAEKDPNCVFPLERMRELEAEHVIGELSDPAFSFMGGIYSARKVRDELAPKILDELERAHVDAFYLVPA